jgi:dTDP-4-dehydrorhamnose 3,5-epimerase
MFELTSLSLPGVVLLSPAIREDRRGRFVKLFHDEFFRSHGLVTQFVEHYHTRSVRGVLRGMHFQMPPADHAKLVTCTEGTLLDVVVDLRAGTPTYGRTACAELDADRAQLIYIPSGCAHGFLALSEQVGTLYAVTSTHDPSRDSGILWSSIDFHWPCQNPIVSDRDQRLPALRNFVSPFTNERTEVSIR